MAEREQRRPERAPDFKDARGRPVTLLDPYELNLLRRYDVIPSETLPVIAVQVGFGLPKWRRRGYVICVLAFLACVVFLVFWKLMRGAGVDAVERVLWPVNLTVFAIGAIQFWRRGRKARAKDICTAMLQHRRCPHCGYDLRMLPSAAKDGTTVCPECGSAWMLEETRTDPVDKEETLAG